jgi:inorganic triphosphatase YgiF
MHGNLPAPRKEIEVKFDLAPDSLRALKKIPLLRAQNGAPKRRVEVSVYFDTDDHKLRKKGLMLRVRRVGGRYIQTIKANGHSVPLERDEWEAVIAGREPDLRLAEGTALEPLMTKKFRRQLKPVFETRVRRTVYPIGDDKNAIALAVDQGTIDTGMRSVPLCEVELELERGTATRLFEVAREVAEALSARIGVKSKSERGYDIIDNKQELPAKAARIDLPTAATTRDAFKSIGLTCLKQVIDNEPALIKGDPEGVHQMRVGLRRLRAATSLFAALLHDPQTVTIKAELKWLAGELGPARELEVLVQRVAPMKRRRRRWRGMPSLSHEIAEQRDAALKRAQDAVRSARFRSLTFDLAAWLQTGQWTNPPDDLVRDRGDLPIAVYAAEQLTRRWRKVRKKGKALAKLDARSRHQLRIQTKKLRYAAEFFASLFSNKRMVKRRKRFLAALERLQDGLGELNDIAVHEKHIAAMSVHHRRSNPSRAFAAGLLTGREDARIESAMAAANEAYLGLSKIKRFWR